MPAPHDTCSLWGLHLATILASHEAHHIDCWTGLLTGACCAGAPSEPESEATASAVSPAPSLSTAALLAQLDAEDAELSEADISAFLPEAIAHLARMLEPMLHNADTAAMFVDEGGVPALLQLYK